MVCGGVGDNGTSVSPSPPLLIAVFVSILSGPEMRLSPLTPWLVMIALLPLSACHIITTSHSPLSAAALQSLTLSCIKNAELKPRRSIWRCKSRGTLIAAHTVRPGQARPGLLIWCQLFDGEWSVASTGYLQLTIWWPSNREIWTSCQLESISILSCPLEIMIRHYCHYSTLVVQL